MPSKPVPDVSHTIYDPGMGNLILALEPHSLLGKLPEAIWVGQEAKKDGAVNIIFTLAQ